MYKNGNEEQSRLDPPNPAGGNNFSPLSELRISLDQMESHSGMASPPPSAIERTQVYLHEHLPICCHPLSATMELVREHLHRMW